MFYAKNKELAELAKKIEDLLKLHAQNKSELDAMIIAVDHKQSLFKQEVDRFNRAIKQKEEELIKIEKRLYDDIEIEREKLKIKESALNKIFSEKSEGFPWLADSLAEFYKYFDYEIAEYLERKKHPAYAKAEQIKEIANQNKLLRKENRIVKSYINYYELLFPWLVEYRDQDLNELLLNISQKEDESNEGEDPVLNYVPRAEYLKMNENERNQKALDRYKKSKKTAWQIGRDYERYIGYQYEIRGFKVRYFGIENGLEDLGRDLICAKGIETHIVQCKYWSSNKTIHEKHINQLYGTAIKYCIDQRLYHQKKGALSLFPDILNENKVIATFITSTKLSSTALKFAEILGVKVYQEKKLEDYPMIKCNMSSSGDKIYHLPFDQQYDKTIVNKADGDFYISTVNEAVARGFRRAFRWKGD
jgi:hypothetical protein